MQQPVIQACYTSARWRIKAGFAEVGRGRRSWLQTISCFQCLVCSVSDAIGEAPSLHESFFSAVAASCPLIVPATYCIFERRLAESLISPCLLRKNQEPKLHMPGPMHLKDRLFFLMQWQRVFLGISIQLS